MKKQMKRLGCTLLCLSLLFTLLPADYVCAAEPLVAASVTLKTENFSMTDIRNASFTKVFDGDDGKHAIILFGDLAACQTTEAVMRALISIAQTTDMTTLNIYAFDVMGNSASAIQSRLTSLEEPGIICVNSTDASTDYDNLFMSCYLANQNMLFPLLVYKAPDGTIYHTSTSRVTADDIKAVLANGGFSGAGAIIPTAAPTPVVTPTPGSATPTPNAAAPSATPDAIPTAVPSPSHSPEDALKVTAFVERMYTVVLGRNAEPGGLTDWTNRLLAHTADGAAVAQGFIMSEEFSAKNVSNEEYVSILYSTFFDRAADTDGQNTWMHLLENGTSRASVLAGFVNSDEFDALCSEYGIIRGTMSDDNSTGIGINGFVERLYSKVLERPGDVEGITTWVSLISADSMSAEEVSKSFFFSDEYLSKSTGDEAFVDTLYQTFMNRTADADGKTFWLNYLAAGASRAEVLEGFSRSVEFGEILESFGL